MLKEHYDRPNYLVKHIDGVVCDGCGKEGTVSDVYNVDGRPTSTWKTIANASHPNIKDLYNHACSVECMDTVLRNGYELSLIKI